ncbi:hypothetical protein Hanom_Chr06g00534161 [Helianthus anomalus]
MDNETLKRLDVYRGVKKGDKPKFREKFVAIKKADYEAPEDDKWRHENNDSDDEIKKMEPLVFKKTRWWKDAKKQKSPQRLVDEPIDLPPENVDVSVAGDHEIFSREIADIIADQDATKAAQNIETAPGGEALKETLVEGEVYTNSSETESDIEVTQIAPTSHVSGKFKLKLTPKKKKASDEEDATYEPTPAEKEKLKKKGIRKRKARPTGELPKRQKVRKVTTFIPEQILEIERPESVEVEISVQSEFRIATPSPSPV